MQELNQSGFSTRVPKLGEIVIFFPNPDDETARSNNAKVCVGIITSPWSSVCVNLKIVPDHGAMQDRGSVTHFSANPAGYHFMFQDEYEAYLKLETKDYLTIKKHLSIDVSKLRDDLKPFLGDIFPPDKKERDELRAKYLQYLKEVWDKREGL